MLFRPWNNLGEWLFGPFDKNYWEAIRELGFTRDDKPTKLKVSCMCHEHNQKHEPETKSA